MHERRASALLAQGELAGAEAAIAEARRRAGGKGEVHVTGAIIDLAAARVGGGLAGSRAARAALDTLRMAADHPALLQSLRARAHAALVAHDASR